MTTTCTGVEMFNKTLDTGEAGDNVGLLLRGVDKEALEPAAWCSAKPGSVNAAHSSSTSEVYVLSKDEGGRHTPFFNNYRPQFYMRTTDVTGTIELIRRRRDVHARRQHRHEGRRSSSPSRWKRVSASPSARAAARSAPAR